MSVVETWCMPWQTSTTGRAKLVVVDEAHTNVAYVKAGDCTARTHSVSKKPKLEVKGASTETSR